MAKSPGFWFFTGDWLKDPELRFCSIFARGLLIDLLCILFEANQRGHASKPDGTPRTDEEIVSAISGGTLEQKLDALRELEASGVLKRNENGVLYHKRLAEISEVQAKRKQAGSKGGSKKVANQQANSQANDVANDKQKPGVSDSDSDTFLEVLAAWNNTLKQRCELTEGRKRALRTRLKDSSWKARWGEAIERVAASRFCKGENDTRWKADLDWFLKPDTVTKILEGKYDNRDAAVVGGHYEDYPRF